MGTCCSAHLAPMVRIYAPNAQNGAVTVQIIENPSLAASCHYCKAPVEFMVSYFPK